MTRERREIKELKAKVYFLEKSFNEVMIAFKECTGKFEGILFTVKGLYIPVILVVVAEGIRLYINISKG